MWLKGVPKWVKGYTFPNTDGDVKKKETTVNGRRRVTVTYDETFFSRSVLAESEEFPTQKEAKEWLDKENERACKLPLVIAGNHSVVLELCTETPPVLRKGEKFFYVLGTTDSYYGNTYYNTSKLKPLTEVAVEILNRAK